MVSTGYLVASSTGYIVIPSAQVYFDADSVEDAWYRMRLQVKQPTVATHLEIARWCFSQKFTRGTIGELREALELDPSNETARLMLKRVDGELRRQAAVSGEHEQSPRAFVAAVEVRQPDDARSLSGLSTETARSFVSQIQPLLLNRCGNARCHGVAASDRDFRLEHLRSSGNQRRRIERNLGAVLKQVDVSRPRHSSLLKAGQGVHGGQLVFVGRAGTLQLESIRGWIFRAVAELGPVDPPVAAQRVPKTGSDADWGDLSPGARSRTPTPQGPTDDGSKFELSGTTVPAVETQQPDRQRIAVAEVPGSTDVPRSPPGSLSSSQLSHVQKLLRETRPVDDVFDPEQFNRKYAR